MEKACVGIDISMDDFHVCLKIRNESQEVKIKGTRTFKNTDNGFKQFYKWFLNKNTSKCEVIFVMEATGIYYENLAYFLNGQNHKVHVALPYKISNYIKSLNVKSKTDKIDSKLIAGYGLERNLDEWEPMSPEYRSIRDLCRELLSIKKEMQRTKCQLHAMKKSHNKLNTVLEVKEQQIDFYEKAIKKIQSEIRKCVAKDDKLKRKIDKVITAPAIGFETAMILIAETNGFKLINNVNQLISYAGLDIQMNESGYFKGKTKISKKGNNRIRQALYMPALTACRINKPIRDLYIRICDKNPQSKKVGVIAAMRKLLILVYVLWKNDEEYDPDYVWDKKSGAKRSAQDNIPKMDVSLS